MWITEGDEFFNQFFRHTDSPPNELPKFPTTPTEKDVTKWIKECTTIFTLRYPNPGWELCYSHDGQRPSLSTSRSSDRWPDIFLLPAGAAPKEWKLIALFGEFKHRSNSANELNIDFLVQLASYAKEIFATQPGHSFVQQHNALLGKSTANVPF